MLLRGAGTSSPLDRRAGSTPLPQPHGMGTWAVPAAGDTSILSYHQPGGRLLCGHSALASVTATVGFQALTYCTVVQLSPEKVKSSLSHPFRGPLSEAFYTAGGGKVLVSGRCGQDGERLQRVLREKDALDLEDVLRKGRWVRNECRHEGQEG